MVDSLLDGATVELGLGLGSSRPDSRWAWKKLASSFNNLMSELEQNFKLV